LELSLALICMAKDQRPNLGLRVGVGVGVGLRLDGLEGIGVGEGLVNSS